MEIICRRNKIRDQLQTDTEGKKGGLARECSGPRGKRTGADSRPATDRVLRRAQQLLGREAWARLPPSLGLGVLLSNMVRTERDNSQHAASLRQMCR